MKLALPYRLPRLRLPAVHANTASTAPVAEVPASAAASGRRRPSASADARRRDAVHRRRRKGPVRLQRDLAAAPPGSTRPTSTTIPMRSPPTSARSAPRRACNTPRTRRNIRRFRASIRTPPASSTSCAAALVLAAPTTPGAAAELNEIATRPAVDLRQGPRHAERQADHRRRHRGRDGRASQSGRAQGDVEELARQCRPRRCATDYAPHGRDRQPGRQGARLSPTPARCGARNYDMTPEEFAAMYDRLWAEVKPLYVAAALLHADQAQREVRRRGAARDRPDPRRPARQHVGAGMGQHLRRRRARRARATSATTSSDAAQGQEVRRRSKMVKAGEGFYTSLGFAPLPETFWHALAVHPARATAKSSATPRPGTSTTRTTCASRCASR